MPTCSTRSGSSSAIRRRSGRALPVAASSRPRSSAGSQSQAGLLERVRPIASRTIDTSGSLASVLASVDQALAEALAGPRGA